jgi:methionyl-tRNA synthetase
VQLIFQRWRDSGDLYPGEYRGWYCVSCESFLKESDEPQPKCPDCGRPAEWNAEASYFFRLSRYQGRLLRLYEEHPDFVRPSGRMNELRTRVAAGLRDLSATRTTLEWAVPLTFDPAHRAYVWIDALINYVSAIGYSTDEKSFRRRWPADVQLIGKDILWFHAAIWPAMLMALGLQPPKGVFAHGWWTHNGEKMSKSKNNFVTPGEVADAYGADALRYFLLRELPFGLDGDFRDAAMLQRYNSELAGDLGNFVFRTLSMMGRYFGGVVPDPGTERNGALAEASGSIYADVDACMAELQFSRALERIWQFVRRANQYVEERKPWSQAKDPAQRPALAATLYHLAEASRILSLLIEPTMPSSAQAIREQLGIAEETRPLAEALAWGGLKPGSKIRRGQPLFPKKET